VKILLPLAVALPFALLLARPGGEHTVAAYATPLEERTRAQRHNAELSMIALDGAVVESGAEFSFNRRVGTFSRDAGYRKAPVSYNGQLIDTWGGGVCQTSTTLYNTALLAGMEVLERHRHQFAPAYVPPGRDAAVAFSNIDLRFRNPHPFPVRIRGRVQAGKLLVEMVADRPLRVRPEVVQVVRNIRAPGEYAIGSGRDFGRIRNSGKPGCEVTVYRIVGDRRELISTDEYPPMHKVVDYRPRESR
jgi:vancomycin resistance protein VanW